MDPDEVSEHWHLVTPGGEDLIEGRAGILLLELLKPTRWLGKVLRLVRAAWLLTLIDRFLGWFRKKAGWMVKDTPGPRRYP